MELEASRPKSLLPNLFWYIGLLLLLYPPLYGVKYIGWEFATLFFFPVHLYLVGRAKVDEYAPDARMHS